jgi:hypothetical protein
MAYTKEKLQALQNELRKGAAENGIDIDDSMAYDIADGVLFDERGLKEYLESKGITDPIGYLADYIF